MKHFAIVIYINLAALCGARAQEHQLLAYEERIYRAGSDTAANRLLEEKFRFELMDTSFSQQAALTLERIRPHLITDSAQRARFFWNAAVYCLVNGWQQQASDYHDRYLGLTHDSSGVSLTLGFVSVFRYSRPKADALLGRLTDADIRYADLACLYEVDAYAKKHLNLYLGFSVVIPGSGIVLLGKPVKGLTATALNGLSVWLTVVLWQQSFYFNAVLLGGMLLTKFYPGNITLTHRVFEEKERKKQKALAGICERSVDDLLGRIDFR